MRFKKAGLAVSIGFALGLPGLANAATPQNWVTTFTSGGLYGASGNITFNDWGYVGPTGANANTFVVTSPVTGVTGFDSNPSRLGQMQTVTTLNPDWLTRDGSRTAFGRTNASQDAQVNFGAGMYTTVGGSTFSNMMIDKAGNYYVPKANMSFAFYDVFMYHDVTGTNPNATVDTTVNFKPYATSDAMGWCGSVLNADPSAVDLMAGQVTFDFAIDAYFGDGAQSLSGGQPFLVPGFVMRSYGNYTMSITSDSAGTTWNYAGSAVMNNNNPTVNPLDASGEVTDAALDPAFQNRVSFLGGSVVPLGVWVTADSYDSGGARVLNPDGTWNVTMLGLCDPFNLDVAPEAGAVCYDNGSFAGTPFLLRADADRNLTFVNAAGFSDYVSAVPVPGAVWLFGSGLAALAGGALRKRRQTR